MVFDFERKEAGGEPIEFNQSSFEDDFEDQIVGDFLDDIYGNQSKMAREDYMKAV